MLTVAIICEYNPFHLGHKVQIDAVREYFRDESVCIIALMSGAYVERGGMALLSAADRTEIALALGVDVVLELPFPWSMSGADYFARGAVNILEALGGIDYLCFGSECGDLEQLTAASKRLNDDRYCRVLDRVATESPMLSWAAVRELAFFEVYGELLRHYPPNDLLAIAYLSHLKTIKPLPITRKPGYSATEARKSFADGDYEKLSTLVPSQTLEALRAKSERAASFAHSDIAVLSALRMMSPNELAEHAESSIELSGLIKRNLSHCSTVEELVAACTNKKYTSSRVRRAVWHAFLKTPKDLPSSDPAYTRLLGCNDVGRAWLGNVRKSADIPVITRISNVRNAPVAEKQYLFAEERSSLRAFILGESEKNLPIVK